MKREYDPETRKVTFTEGTRQHVVSLGKGVDPAIVHQIMPVMPNSSWGFGGLFGNLAGPSPQYSILGGLKADVKPTSLLEQLKRFLRT